MSQSYDRSVMINNVYALEYAELEEAPLAVGSTGGYEFLLPKYSISTGRDGDTESLSQCRIYMDEAAKWFNKTDFKLGNVDPEGKSYVGFLLTGVQENKSEKVQTTPLHGDNYAATFYGQSPTVYSFSGILYNTHFAPWREIFSILYDKAFRGSQISRHRKLLHIVYDNKVVSGWMLNLAQSISSSSDTMSNFSFQFLVRSETILTPTSQLEYNNAYFTGAKVESANLDTLAELPEYDDYINSARIRTPPRRQRGGTGAKRKSAMCRPGKGGTIKDGNTMKTNPRFEGQNIRPGSPTSTSCDVSEAVFTVVRELKKKTAEIEEEYKKKKNPTQADTEAKDSAITKAQENARRLLSTSWEDLNNRVKIKDASAQERANVLYGLSRSGGTKEGFLKYVESLSKKSEEDIAREYSLLPALNYATPQEVKSNAP